MRHRRAAAAATAAVADRLIAHVPADAVHAGLRPDRHRRRRPVERQAAVGRGRVLLTELVVGLRDRCAGSGLRTGSVLEIACGQDLPVPSRISSVTGAGTAPAAGSNRGSRPAADSRRPGSSGGHGVGSFMPKRTRTAGAGLTRYAAPDSAAARIFAACRSGVTSSRIQKPRPCVPATRSEHRQIASSFTCRSRTEIAGMSSRSDCQ